MGGLIRFLAWFAFLVAGFVLVVLPLVMGPLLVGVVRDMGVRAGTIDVSVALFDPGLILGRSRQVTISATEIDLSPATIGSFRLALGGASYFERTFETVSGEMSDVRLAVGSDTVSAGSATVDGPADSATVIARFAAPEVEQLIMIAAAHNGLSLDRVTVTSSGLRVSAHGIDADARLLVRGGALLLDTGLGGAVVLLQPASSDPWRLNDAWFSDRGLNVAGTVDVARIVRDLARGARQG